MNDKKEIEIYVATDSEGLVLYSQEITEEHPCLNLQKMLRRIDMKCKDYLLGQEEKLYSSLTGRIEWLNVHGENKFYIYPTDGTSRVLGEFQDNLKKTVIDSI